MILFDATFLQNLVMNDGFQGRFLKIRTRVIKNSTLPTLPN